MELDDIPLRKVDKDELDKLCVSMIDIGEVEARAKYLDGDPSKNITELRGKWEGYHLVDYAGFVKDKTDDDELEKSYKQFGQSINKTRSHASHGGGKNKEKPRNILKGLATAHNLSLIQCFVDFLEFCARANNGDGLPISIYSYDRHLLMASISKKKTYIEDELVRLDGSSKQEIKKFDGINIFWEQPNNEHEQPCCKIEPCIGQKHLSVPNTFSNIELEQPSTVLGWSSNITDFVGREKEKEKLHKWLNSRAEKSIQLISGEGGVGKTRLAFDFAYNEIDSKEWGAGQATIDLKGRWYMGSKGMLLIVDYPEERETTLKQFLRAISEMGELSAEKRLRVLLLSRNPKFYDVIEEEAPRIQSPAINLKVLETDDEQWALAKNAWKGIQYQHALINEQLPISEQYPQFPIGKSSFIAWQTNPKQPLNATALMVISLVYYIYCEPDIAIKKPIELTGKSIIRYMTKREIKFIRKEVSYYFGLKKLGNTFELEGVFLLKAVCAISGGFDGKRLKEFIDEVHQSSIQYQLPSIEDIQSINILNCGATHSNGKTQQLCALTDEKLLPALAPDILASDFLVYCLEEYAQKQQAIWVFLATGITKGGDSEDENDYIKENFSKLGRLIFDAKIKLQADYWPVEKLIDALDKNLDFCSWIAQNHSGESVEVHLEHLIHFALTKCLNTASLSDEKRANYLSNLCFFRGENNIEQTLNICSESHQIYKLLAKSNPNTYQENLASILNLLAGCLSENEFKEKAIEASEKSIVIYEELYARAPSKFASEFAHSLMCFSAYLSEHDKNEQALEAASKAMELYREVESKHGIGQTLRYISMGLSYTNQKVEALRAARESVEIYELLAFENPAIYSDILADNLYELSASLAENNKMQEALQVCKRSVDLYKKLAKENVSYLGNLANNLTALASKMEHNNQVKAAIETTTEALEIYEILEEKNPSLYASGLAYNFVNLSTYLSNSNQKTEAMKLINKAVRHYEELVKKNSSVYSSALAYCLECYSLRLSENNRKAMALKVQKRAVKIYEKLIIKSPLTYSSDLASSMEGLSRRLSECNEKKAAIAAIERGVLLFEHLVKSNPIAYSDSLAKCLRTLSHELRGQNKKLEALAVTERSVDIYKSLVEENPSTYNYELGLSLIELSDCLCDINKVSRALEIAYQSSEIYAQLAEESFSEYGEMEAYSLSHLSYYMGLCNHKNEALVTISLAIEKYELLAIDDEVSYKFDVANSYSALSDCLANCDKNSEALDAIEHSVELYECLALENPSTYKSYLASGYQKLSDELSVNGKKMKALETSNAAVLIYEELAKDEPEVYERDLAGSLNVLSTRLRDTNNKSLGLETIKKVFDKCQTRAKNKSLIYSRDLALYSMNYALFLFEANRKQEALKMAAKANEIYEHLANEQPETFNQELALCLSNYSYFLRDSQFKELALKVIERAVALYEQIRLKDAQQLSFLYAHSLINLSFILSDNSQKKESLKVVVDGVKICKGLEENNTNSGLVAYALASYATILSENNQSASALLVIQESIERYEQLSYESAETFKPEMAKALINLSNRLFENNKNDTAIEVLERAVDLYNELSKNEPDYYLVHLGNCLFEYCKLRLYEPYIIDIFNIYLANRETCIETWILDFKPSCYHLMEKAKKENNNSAFSTIKTLLKKID
jgi:hypothetical protein